MPRDSDRRPRRPSDLSSRDARSAIQREDTRTSMGSSRGGDRRRSGDIVPPRAAMPPQAASTYVAHSSGRDGREYRRPTAYTTAAHDVPRYGHAYHPVAPRARRKSSPSVDKEYRKNRVSTGLTSSSDEVDSEDDEESDDFDDDVIVTVSNTKRRRRDTIVPQLESTDESSPTRGRGQTERYGDSSEEDEPRGAELRTPSTSSRDEDISPSTRRMRTRLIEAAPTQPRPHHPRAASDAVEQQHPRSTRRSSRRSEPVVLQQRVSPRKARREPSHSDSSRLSSIVSSGTGTNYHAEPRVKVRPAMPARVATCLSCNTDHPLDNVSRLQCGHKMCQCCLKQRFELACRNPQYMPPTCCTDEPIPYEYVEPLFDTVFKKAFYRRSRDSATPGRLYCPSRSCGESFAPKSMKSDGVRSSTRCETCNQKICLSCNSKWHVAPDCQAEAAGPNHARHPRDAGRQRCQPSIINGYKHYYADRNVAEEESESDEAPPVRQFAGRRDARPRVYHAEPTRQRKVSDNYDEDLARQMELDMALEDTDDDNEEYDITVGRMEREGSGLSSGGRRRNTHYSHSSGRTRTQVRESPPAHEHAGYKTPPRSVYDRGNYVSEIGRARGGVRSDSFREDSMERRLAQRLSEPRPNAGPPMGFPPGPPHGGPAGMMPQAVPPPPMGPTPYQPHQMRMPLGSVPLTSSPPMMSSPPHPFGSFPPHPSQAIHYQPPPARSMMSDYDHGGSPRSSNGPRSSSMAGLSSHGGEGKGRVQEWRRHVDAGAAAHDEYIVPETIPEERMISG